MKIKMTNKLFVLNLIIPFLFNSCKSAALPPENFIIILVDDLGWRDLSYAGSTFFESPNLDSLSINSIQFTNAYSSSPVCSPARASILTGKSPSKLNITDWIPGDDPKNRKLLGPKDFDHLPLEEITIAEALKEKDYVTFFAGKWHLGGGEFTPENQGFDVNIGGSHYGQPPGGYYSPYKNNKIKDGPEGEYLTDRLTDETISFINANSNNPFFVFLSYYSVHTPIQPNKDYIKKFKDKLHTISNHEVKKRALGNAQSRLDQYNPEYASMIYSLDRNVGKIINELKSKGLYENTTIIFTSDNGGLSTLENHNNRSPTAPTSVEPLKGGKGWLYEGGLKVPFLLKPAKFNEKGWKIETPISGFDIFPTILSMAGVKIKPIQKIEGLDLSDLINGKPMIRDELFWHYPHYHGSGWTPGTAIRKGDWKLIHFIEDNHYELYNVKIDISEQKDLKDKYPQKLKELTTELVKMKAKTNAKTPTVNSDYIYK